jgi:uncharacterized protein (TIGR03382 family)
VFTTLWLSLAVAVHPAGKFLQAHPDAQRIASADGTQLVHASGFTAETGARTPQDSARAFLATHGAAFGVRERQTVELIGAHRAGEVGPVRFSRKIDGLPIFGGDLTVGVDASNRVFLVNASGVAPLISGRHAIGESAAGRAALATFPGGVRGAGPARVEAGWHSFGAATRAVYRVDFVARDPAGDWRILVDGESGAPLFRIDLRAYATAPGSAFEISPVETAASLCPVSGGGTRTLCATPVSVTFPNLATGADLTGTQTTVYNCNGTNDPTSATGIPGACSSVSALSGAFAFTVDTTYTSTSDNFAAAMAYYHLDKHVSFFKKLDSTIPAPSGSSSGSSKALRGSLPALVNTYDANLPFENAFFSPGLDAMVFGQGSHADYAYDATVMYHELTHGVVWAWGGFNPVFDLSGTNWESFSVNEGTADSMAASETGRSLVGSFLGAVNPTSLFGGRDLADANAARSCQGDGTLVTRFGVPGVNGVDGEEHDDGEIWNGFFWEVFDGLRAAGIKGCGGACDAGGQIQYKALQLAAGTAPTFNSYWQTFKSAAASLFPSNPDVPTYIECVGRRRKLDHCDRTFPLFAGESKVQVVRARFSSFQLAVPTTGNATVDVCSGGGSSTTIYGRVGQPVQVTGFDANGNAVVVADGQLNFTNACSGAPFPIDLNGGGTWYLLLDLGPSGPGEAYRFVVGQTNVTSRPAPAAPTTCALSAALSILPDAPSLPPRGQVIFSASGGSGGGYVWSFATNASGGTIAASTGVYSAGPAGNVADVVKVTDSAGRSATKSVAVTAGVSIAPASTSAARNGVVNFTATGGSGTGYAWTFTTNASGGAINLESGMYVAGQTGGVTDVVKVTDSLGNVAGANISVSGTSQAGGGTGGGCSTTGINDAPTLALALALLLLGCRRRRRRGSVGESA